MDRNLQSRTDRRVKVAVGLLAAVLALLGSQQLARGGGASPAGLGDIAYQAAPFGTLAGEHQQAGSERPR